MLWAQRPYESLIATIPLACLLAFPKFPQSVEAPNAAANMITWSESEEATDEFYESLDRILSSSCSSTSTSDDEGDLYRRRRSYLPLPSAASYNAWLCEPASVKERRRRLLHHMGLAVDPDLARLELEGDAAELSRSRERELGRSASCDGLCPHLISPSPSPLPSPSPIAIPSHGSMSRSISDFSVCDGRSPLVGRSKVSYGDFDHRKDERRCTIRDLDNGKEFVVMEFNGIRNQLREVGTGRKLTMDEFEACVGRSPIVQELMRRQIVEDGVNSSGGGGRYKRRSSWFKSFKCVVATGRERRSSDEKDSSSERGGRRSSSATDDSQDMPPSIPHGPEWTKIRRYGKTRKELTGLYMGQEIQAHDGSIWTIKFSLDGSYLASAGEDCVIHVWQVLEHEKKWGLLMDRGKENGNYYSGDAPDNRNGDVVPAYELASEEASYWEKTTRTKRTGGRKPVTLDNLVVPRQAFALAERPVCTFRGHLGDVLNLSWSKSQHVLSSSMDKTVRLWHLSSNSCLKIFSHMDYVTCIQFNPVDDRYFISGSLDAKIRLWSIPDRQIVDWNDLHEMVTAVCYSPDGQGALVGSHKGNCHFFDTSDNKLVQKKLLDLQNKRKKSSRKKITGLQFAPGSSTEVLITSADSRIRVVDENDLIHKFKGFRNTSSQISACFTECGEHVICASEDSQVYLWRYDAIVSKPCGSKGAVRVTRAYEYFRCPSVTAALPWPAAVFSASVHGSKPQAKDRGIVIVASTRGGEIRTFQNLIP